MHVQDSNPDSSIHKTMHDWMLMKKKMLAQGLNPDQSIFCFSLLFLAGEIEALPALFSQNYKIMNF